MIFSFRLMYENKEMNNPHQLSNHEQYLWLLHHKSKQSGNISSILLGFILLLLIVVVMCKKKMFYLLFQKLLLYSSQTKMVYFRPFQETISDCKYFLQII